MLYWLPVFITLFLGELGDKTQVATLIFAADSNRNPWMLFLVGSLALSASTGMATLVGHYGGKYLEGVPLKLLAGIGFIAIGLWTIFDHLRSSP